MKKFIKLFTSLLVLTAITSSAWSLEAKIKSISGKVEIQTDGSTWKNAKVGDILRKGAIISTGFKSSATLVIDNATVNLDAMTRITIEKLASNSSKNQTNLYLNNGKVSADVQKSTAGKKVDFKVSSAASTASVRGTSFSFYADGTLETATGLVSKGSGKKAPEIAKNDEADSFLPEDGESDALTETKAVSGAREIPVYAGQKSTTDQLSGISLSPQEEDSKRKAPSSSSGTEKLTSFELGTSISPEMDNSGLLIQNLKSGDMELELVLP